MKVLKYSNTMKKGESYSFNVVKVDDLIKWCKKRPFCNVRNLLLKELEESNK